MNFNFVLSGNKMGAVLTEFLSTEG